MTPVRISHKQLKTMMGSPCVRAALGTPLDQALSLLMGRPDIPVKLGRRPVTLGPEQGVCVNFADAMRAHTLAGRYRGIWCHVANEGLRSPLVGAILRAMGLISGALDYFFAGPWGVGLIEMKHGRGQLTPEQEAFMVWCEANGVPTAEHKSVEGAEATLRQWRALL